MSLGEKIKFYRHIRNLTKQEVAEKVGVTEKNIEDFEVGKEEPGVSVMKKIAETLQVHVGHFMEDDKINRYPLESLLEEQKDIEYPASFIEYLEKEQGVTYRILLSDTLDRERRETKKFLEATYDCVVVEAKTGVEGVLLYHEAWKGQKPFDFVIMDFLLYGEEQINGIEATSYIHKINPKAIVIMTSRMEHEFFFLNGIRNGVTNFIWKSNLVGMNVDQYLKKPLDAIIHKKHKEKRLNS